MRLLKLLLITLIVIIIQSPKVTLAFPPPNNRWIIGVEYSSVIPHVADTGELTYEVTDDYGFPSWHSIVTRALDSGSDDPLSLGNVINAKLNGLGYLTVREATPNETADLNQMAETPGVTSGLCGGTFATACAYITDARPARTIYNAGSMSTWGYTSNAPVVRHETKHHLDWSCDQYIGGCPPTDNQAFQCTGNPDTLQDCGGAARTVTDFDFGNFLGVYTPDHPLNAAIAVFGNSIVVSWGMNRLDGGYASPFKTNYTARDTTFAFSKYNQSLIWAGNICGPDFNYCYTNPKDLSRGFDSYWYNNFDCAYLRMENSITRLIPQSSELGLSDGTPDGYWKSIGCWR